MSLRTQVIFPSLLLAALVAPGCNEGPMEPTPPTPMAWPSNDDYPGVGNGRLVITNNFSDTLSILDMDSFDLVMDLPVGLNPVDLEGPHHVASDVAGEYYYMALSQAVQTTGSGPHGAHGSGVVPGYVVKFRASDNKMLGRVRIDRNPGDVQVTTDGKTVLVSHFDLRRVQDVLSSPDRPDDPAEIYKKTRSALAILDADQMDLDGNGLKKLVYTCPAAHGVRLSPDNRYAYMSCLSSDELAVIDLQHPDLYSEDPSAAVKLHYVGGEDGQPNTSPNFEAPQFGPYSVSVSPTDGVVWVSCQLFQGQGELRPYDPALGRMDLDRTVRMEGAPFFGSFSKDGKRLYMAQQAPDAVVAIDPQESKVVDTLRLCPYLCNGECSRTDTCEDGSVTTDLQCFKAHVIEVLPDERTAAFICEGNWPTTRGTALQIGLEPLSIKKTLVVDTYPDGVAIVKGR